MLTHDIWHISRERPLWNIRRKRPIKRIMLVIKGDKASPKGIVH